MNNYPGSLIEFALICERVTHNENGSLNLHGVANNLEIILGEPKRVAFVIKILGAADADDRRAIPFGELRVILTGPKPAFETIAAQQPPKTYPVKWVKNIHWTEQYCVIEEEVTFAERGQYQVEIFNELVLAWKFVFSAR